jgi:phosphate starvation-inducible PhoH-like protein
MTLNITLHDSLTPKQRQILKCKSENVLLTGPAGTSKSYIALAKGLMLLMRKQVERIVIIRSAVETRRIGFLPGAADEKLEAYHAPYIHLVDELSPKQKFKTFIAKREIDFMSTSFLRGVTFDNTFIFMDEFQNCNEHELETVLTRKGEGSYLFLAGDSEQSDLMHNEKHEHHAVIKTVKHMPEFESFEFTVNDIVRSAFVKSYYETKNRLRNQRAIPMLREPDQQNQGQLVSA